MRHKHAGHKWPKCLCRGDLSPRHVALTPPLCRQAGEISAQSAHKMCRWAGNRVWPCSLLTPGVNKELGQTLAELWSHLWPKPSSTFWPQDVTQLCAASSLCRQCDRAAAQSCGHIMWPQLPVTAILACWPCHRRVCCLRTVNLWFTASFSWPSWPTKRWPQTAGVTGCLAGEPA
jgi:hypothetical protein